jgi:hypothetical protein
VHEIRGFENAGVAFGGWYDNHVGLTDGILRDKRPACSSEERASDGRYPDGDRRQQDDRQDQRQAWPFDERLHAFGETGVRAVRAHFITDHGRCAVAAYRPTSRGAWA